jgi:hypothetical protein
VKLLALLGVLALSAGTAKPSLRPVDQSPLTLAGSGFRTGERVKLLLAAPPVVSSRSVRASRRGTFRVAFSLTVGRCDAVVVQAIGARGSRATFRQDALHCAEP